MNKINTDESPQIITNVKRSGNHSCSRLDFIIPILIYLLNRNCSGENMSYKHNNLMAMRENYWNDQHSPTVQSEKQFLQQFLIQHQIFPQATLEDAKYFFFTLPSIIIVKAHALGFHHQTVQQLLLTHIQQHHRLLTKRSHLKIRFNLR